MKINTQRGIAPFIVLLIVAGIAVGGGTVAVKKNAAKKAEKAAMEALATSTDSMKKGSTTPHTIQVTLKEQSASGQNGTAVLTEVNGKVKVIVNLSGKPSTVTQPAHIHLGSCATIGGVKYPLTNISNGAAQTMLDISLTDFVKLLPLSINVHKSASEASVYVACGDILAANVKSISGASLNIKDPKVATTSLKANGSVNVNVDASVNVQ
ncbi:MAG: hypothetical protein M3Q73_00355 [bacterium]|nr:hypothetical protein [bacterium]